MPPPILPEAKQLLDILTNKQARALSQSDTEMASNKTASAEANFVLASVGKAPSNLNFRN